MNKALMARAISKRSGPPKSEVSQTKVEASTSKVIPQPPKTVMPSPEMQKELLAAKALTDSGDYNGSLDAYKNFMKAYAGSPEMKDPKVGGNILLLFGKAALAAGDKELSAKKLNEAGNLIPSNPQVWRGLVDCYEGTDNLGALQTALAKCVEVAESKGNYSRSRPLRIRLAEVQENLGDSGGALATLKTFVTNGKAVSSPGEDGSPNAEDLNELMRLRCSALTRGLSGNAVLLPTASPPSHQAKVLGNGSVHSSYNNLSNAVKAYTPTRQRDPERAKIVNGSPSSAKSESTSTSVSTLGGHSRAVNDVPVAGWILLAAAQPTQDLAELKAMGDSERLSRLSTLCMMLSGDETGEGRRRAAVAIAEAIAASTAEAPWVEAQLAGYLADSGSPTAREGALLAIQAQCQLARYASEPFLISLLPAVLAAYADGFVGVRHTAVDAGSALIRALNPHAVRLVLPHIIGAMESREWRVKVGSLEMVAVLAGRASSQMASALPELVPIVSKQVWDTHRQVQAASKHALLSICTCIANPDIEPLVDKLVSVIAHPEESPTTLDALMATTFVTRVDGATLSVIAPLLGKCLRERNAGMRRKAAKIISNMCKLVMDPIDVAPFVPLLLPALQKVVAETADPEVTVVVQEALDTLMRAVGGGQAAIQAKSGVTGPSWEEVTAMKTEMSGSLRKAVMNHMCTDTDISDTSDEDSSDQKNPLDEIVLSYLSGLCTSIVLFSRSDKGPLDIATWRDAVLPYLAACCTEEQAEKAFSEFYKNAIGVLTAEKEETDAADICNIEFSLAYGGKILLHNTRLRLRAGHRYGLIGANGAGKTTLMRNIANGNIDGLPEELRTVYVEHDILGSDGSTPVAEFVVSVLDVEESISKVKDTLKGVGFTDDMISAPVSSLSGGWKMKLALARAMLMNANVLLLDEPTNHLDTTAVAWLTSYLAGLTDVTVLVVSHDTSFLDNVVTDILHYESQKLVPYHGNLSHFVRLRPEAKSYYALEAASLRFKFPNPGPLDGINSTTKSILTLSNASYTYPGSSNPTLIGANLKLCLASRVAVVGVNGAGKTTLIKLVVRESEPDTGEVWAHHNLRIAYVAQHSFHHVEQHLKKSPVQYMQWRYGSGDGTDREAKENNMAMKLTEEEEERLSKVGAVENLYGRRKTGRTLEYECSFVGMGPEYNRYITLEKLVEMGCQKLVQQADNRVAAQAAGLDSRPTTTREIQQHLDDFALAPEFSVHGKIGGLSGGQKVKLVLAAAMWNRPHLLVLDEPTNYLDREALGALTLGIKEFGGGVIMISHNQEFLSAICTETWILESGRLYTKGEVQETVLKTASRRKEVEEEEEVSTAGCTNKTVSYDNLINPKSLKLLSKKEVRKLAKLAEKAEIALPQYVASITRASPEWKWLSS